MVKTLSIALFCSLVLLAGSHAQEVFNADQKAKPKYPKAQVVTADHAKSASHAEKAVAIQADKIEAAAKPASASKPAVAQSAKHETSPVLIKKPTVATSQSATKAASPATHDEKKAEVAQVVKPTVAQDHSAALPKTVRAAVPPAKTVAAAKGPKVETVTAKSAAVSVPAAGPKYELAAHPVKKTSTSEAKLAASPAPKALVVEVPAKKGPAVEETKTPLPGLKPPKAAVATAPKVQKAVTTETLAAVRPKAAPLASAPSRKESGVPSKPSPARVAVADPAPIAQPVSTHFDTAFTRLADGFDFPVGRPDAQGYYKARGFRSHGHLGEDWDGVGGGDTDLGDPICSIADGLVVFARDCHMGWGNVLIVRHSYREGGTVKTVDALYGHLSTMLVRRGQAVTRGQKIATMGNAHGLYDAHLHLEIRKNLEIGMSRAAFARDFGNYYDPSQFIQTHRHLQGGGKGYRVAMNTFTRDERIRWDKARNYSRAHTGGGSSESAAALKRALASQH